MIEYSFVHYHPWVGANYAARPLLGKKTLILGESHYGDEQGDCNLTTRCIQHFELEQGDKNRFYRLVPSAVMGYDNADAMGHDERVLFWDSVVFYNYIQESVHDGPGGKRTKVQWQNAEPAFFEVLFRYEPEVILAFGVTLGNNLSHAHGRKVDVDGLKCVEYTYPSGAKGLLAVMTHPAGGMSYEEVREVTRKFGLEMKKA